MVATIGLTGLRPDPSRAAQIASPPYDVIKPGTQLERLLQGRADSLFHIILGDRPAMARDRLLENGALIEDEEPAYYVYEQTWDGGQRTGALVAAAVSPYQDKQVIRHEKTFVNPPGLAILVRDDMDDAEIDARVARVDALRYDRV